MGGLHIILDKKLKEEAVSKEVLAQLDELLDILFRSLQSSGEILGNLCLTREVDKSAARETVACMLLELLTIDYVSKNLSVTRWEQLGWSFTEQNEIVRRSIVSSYSTIIQTTALHIRYLAYSCLIASDDKSYKAIEKCMLFALNRFRCTHDDLIGKAMEYEDRKLIGLAENVIPECIVPYCMYLLCHAPVCSGEENRSKAVAESIRFIYNCLRSSLRQGSDNMSYLIQQVNLLSSRYRDHNATDERSLMMVTRVADQILNDSIKTVENVQPFKGNISIPTELFEYRSGNGEKILTSDKSMKVQSRVK